MATLLWGPLLPENDHVLDDFRQAELKQGDFRCLLLAEFPVWPWLGTRRWQSRATVAHGIRVAECDKGI